MYIKKFWKDPLEIKLFIFIGRWNRGLGKKIYFLLFAVTFLYSLIVELRKFKSFNAREKNVCNLHI